MMSAAAAVAVHPSLWATAVGQARRLAPRQWWRRRPFLPVPDRAYLEFRLLTQYGSVDAPMSGDDVVQDLRGCRAMARHAAT